MAVRAAVLHGAPPLQRARLRRLAACAAAAVELLPLSRGADEEKEERGKGEGGTEHRRLAPLPLDGEQRPTAPPRLKPAASRRCSSPRRAIATVLSAAPRQQHDDEEKEGLVMKPSNGVVEHDAMLFW